MYVDTSCYGSVHWSQLLREPFWKALDVVILLTWPLTSDLCFLQLLGMILSIGLCKSIHTEDYTKVPKYWRWRQGTLWHTHTRSLSLPPFIWRNPFGADVYLLSFLFNLFRFCFVFFLEALVSFLSVQFPLEHFRDCSYGLERKTGREQTGSQRQQRCGESRTGSVKRGQRRWECRKRWRVVSCPRQMVYHILLGKINFVIRSESWSSLFVSSRRVQS